MVNTTFLVVAIAALFVAYGLIQTKPEKRRDRMVALGWAGALAGVSYLLWSSFTIDDVSAAVSWAGGDGLPWLGAGFVAVAGFVWYDTAQEADDADEFVDGLQERTTGPILQLAGVLTAIIVTVATVLFTGGSSLAMLLGFVGELVSGAPMEVANILTMIFGWVALDGYVPLVDPFIPDLSRRYYVGLAMAAFGVGLAIKNTTGESS